MAHAAREIVLSGGTYNSPQLLMLSGVGPADHLREMGVKALIDLPAVGQNLQEHVNTFVNFNCRQPVSLDPQMRADRLTWHIARWLLFRHGLAANLPLQSASFIRVHAESERPDIEFLVSPISPNAHPWFPGIKKPVGHQYSSRIAVLHPSSRDE